MRGLEFREKVNQIKAAAFLASFHLLTGDSLSAPWSADGHCLPRAQGLRHHLIACSPPGHKDRIA